MTLSTTTTSGEESTPARWPWLPKVAKYCGNAVVATVCSEVAFVVMYGVLAASTTWSSVVGWLAGALPNYLLNRHWTWGRRGLPSFRREVLPYLAIVLCTLGLASLLSGAAHRALTHYEVADTVRVALVAAAFLGVYVLMFALKFLLFDRLFARLERHEAAAEAAPKETVVD